MTDHHPVVATLDRSMPAREAHPQPQSQSQRIVRGQTALLDLRAGSSLIALEGTLHVAWQDRALGWLGADAPRSCVTLDEGARFVVPQHGALWVAATCARASFVVAAPRRERGAFAALRRAARRIAVSIGWRARRAAAPL